MTITELEQKCPAAFATEPSKDVSSKYVFFDSRDVINECYDRGMQAMSELVKRGKDPTHGQHVIRFRDPTYTTARLNDIVPELVLINSHDRTRRFQLSAGLQRLVCSNGLTVSHWHGEDNTSFKRKHIEVCPKEVVENVLQSFDRVWPVVQRMQHTQCTNDLRRALASTAMLLSHDGNTHYTQHIPLGTLLSPRRDADTGTDLWTVLNVVQEYAVRGGYTLPSGRTAGPVTEPTRVEKINRGLWQAAHQIAFAV